MALLPQNPRSQKLLLLAIAALALGGTYWQLLWAPQQTELVALEARLDTLDSLNRVAKHEVAKGNADKMRAEADAYGRELLMLRHLVPTETEVPALVESVSSAARRAGLELADVQPDGIVNGDQFDTYRFKLGVTGPYHQIAAFLNNIGTLPRIVSPINLTLLPTNRVGELKPKKNEQFLDAKFQIQTYVAHASKLAPPSGKPGAP